MDVSLSLRVTGRAAASRGGVVAARGILATTTCPARLEISRCGEPAGPQNESAVWRSPPGKTARSARRRRCEPFAGRPPRRLAVHVGDDEQHQHEEPNRGERQGCRDSH